MGYTKLFSDIVMSTIWREPDHVRIVWVTMLAMADKDSTVHGSIPGLADASRVTLEQCEEALERLSEPDPYSRTKAYEGRRIAEVDGGWHLLNGPKYRAKMSTEERRAYKTQKAREYRARDKAEEERCRHSVDKSRQAGTVNGQAQTLVTQAEAEAEAENNNSASASADGARFSSTDDDFSLSKTLSAKTNPCAKKTPKKDRFEPDFWGVVHKKIGKEVSRRAWTKAVKRVHAERNGITIDDAAQLIIDAMAEFANSPAADPDDHTPIHPATWLNQGRYDDDPDTWQETNGRKEIQF